MQLGRHAIFVGSQLVQISTLGTNPLGIVVPLGPVIARRVTEFPVRIAVVDARLGSMPGAL